MYYINKTQRKAIEAESWNCPSAIPSLEPLVLMHNKLFLLSNVTQFVA